MCAAHSVADEGLLSAERVEATKTPARPPEQAPQCLPWRARLSISITRQPPCPDCCYQTTESSRAGFQQNSIYQNRKGSGVEGCSQLTPSLNGEVDMKMDSTKRGSHVPQDGMGSEEPHLDLQGSFCCLTQRQHHQLHTSSFQWLPAGPQSENQVGLPEAAPLAALLRHISPGPNRQKLAHLQSWTLGPVIPPAGAPDT